MSFESGSQNVPDQEEQMPVSAKSVAEKLNLKETYPKARIALSLVVMLGFGTANETAKAQNEVTGGVAQHEGKDTTEHSSTVVTPRADRAWFIPSEITIPNNVPSHERGVTIDSSAEVGGRVSGDVSVGKVRIDGKEVSGD